MRKILGSFLIIVIGIALIAGCSLFNDSFGRLIVSMTDAPIDSGDIVKVNVTIDSIAVNLDDDSETEDGWITLADFTTIEGFDNTFDIMELVNGELAELVAVDLEPGSYGQIRLNLSDEAGANHLVMASGPDEELTVNGNHSLKIVGGFEIESNGTVSLILDFDLRKSIVKNNNGYLLKPTIKLLVEDETGSIEGEISADAEGSYMVYAYEETLTSGELDSEKAPALADTNFFPNAVASDLAELADGSVAAPYRYEYILPYLDEGTYTLYVVLHSFDGSGNESVEVKHTAEDIAVTAENNTDHDIYLNAE